MANSRCPNGEEICLHPAQGHTVREVLASQFINSWLSEHQTRAANRLAADTRATDEQLERMLAELEDSVNGAHAMWRWSC